MVGRTPCKTAPRILNTSPASQMIRNSNERPSAEPRRKFSIICGEKTTTQQAMEIELLGCSGWLVRAMNYRPKEKERERERYPQIPLNASRSKLPA